MSRLPPICCAALAAALVSPAATLASDQPSHEEIAKARARCHADQATLAKLERDANWCTGDARLLSVRDAAEHSCGHAEALLIAAGIEPRPAKPQPAPPTPRIVISEKVRTDANAPNAGEPVAQFAAMEADRRCAR